MAAEDVYRDGLRRSYLAEALEYLREDCETVKNFGCCRAVLPRAA
jgi:hypothetical protein